ncbi:triose-phosphate isomerase [Candidatus Saccharibacteria bacterium]|nr:MAG: triose-phosphate isomerase [Candidatus Saccharibacteria bacterium]
MTAKPKKYIVANWKMNFNVHDSSVFLYKLDSATSAHRDTEIVLAPSFLALQTMSLQHDRRKFKLASQNLYWHDEGAFTGEVSANQLRGLVKYALVGHSERRHIFGEKGRDIGRKVQASVRNNIQPILCVGETSFERQEGETNDVLHDQIVGGLSNVTSDEMSQVLIAYEPVWAIGSGKSAMPDEIKQASEVIRENIHHLFGANVAKKVPILYGGSVSPDNASAFLNTDGIDGLLVGGASLDVDEFVKIIEIAHSLKS